MRQSNASHAKAWLVLRLTQLRLWKDLVIRRVRQFFEKLKAMLFSQKIVSESADRSVLIDVKAHLSVAKDLTNSQITEIPIANSTFIDIPDSIETPLLGSVKSTAIATTIGEPTTQLVPKIKSGSYAEQGEYRPYMEDKHICIDDLSVHLGSSVFRFPVPISFYGVFDGHGGSQASQYIKDNVTRFFFEDAVFRQFPSIVNTYFLEELEKSHRKAYKLADLAMEDESIVTGSCGTTSLTAFVIGQHLMVANAGDCRAVLCRNGKAVDMSSDHRSTFEPERRRAEDLGGYFIDEYLYGEIAVTRALGDWNTKRLSSQGGSTSALISDPDIQLMMLTEEDEFLIMGCDGLWDKMGSQDAVSWARKLLRRHDDPNKCAMGLGNEAIKRGSTDNVTVVVICFRPVPPPPPMRRLKFGPSVKVEPN